MGKGRGLNMETVRSSNIGAVLSYLNTYGASSRKKIAEDLKLTTATLTILTSDLIKEGLLVELGEVTENKVGRKKILIDINEKSRFCLGLEIQKRKIIFIITDLKANIIFEKEWSREKSFDIEEFNKILDFIENEIKEIKEKILGMGILVQGEIENKIAISSPIPNILEIVEKRLEIKCLLENNMKGLVLSEMHFKENHRNFWVLKYGPGVGTSVVLDGKILQGTENKPIEFGHTPLFRKNSNNYCSICKKSGCVESEVHFDHVVKKFIDLGYEKNEEETDFDFVNRVSKKSGMEILNNVLDILSDYIILASWIVPVDELILSGRFFSEERFFKAFKNKLKNKPSNIKQENISCMKDYSYKRKIAGAILILEDFFNNY